MCRGLVSVGAAPELGGELGVEGLEGFDLGACGGFVAGGEVGEAEVVVCVGVVGLEADGLLEGGDGFARATGGGVGPAEVVVRDGLFRQKLRDAPEGGDGLLRPP